MNVVSSIVKALVGITNVIEDVIFNVLIKPLLLMLYSIVRATQWVEVIDHLFNLLAESWPPAGSDLGHNKDREKK